MRGGGGGGGGEGGCGEGGGSGVGGWVGSLTVKICPLIRKSEDYVYDILVYKALGI